MTKSNLSEEEIKQEMSKAMDEARPMIHAFVSGKLAKIIKDKIKNNKGDNRG